MYEAPYVINADGTKTWYPDPARVAVVALLGDDFDYSTITEEQFEELAEGIRRRRAKLASVPPGPERTKAILEGRL